ncbi:heme oxygenase [Glaciihabitans tibetensis]|uniref:Heme oxygenase n=1 Tax=Glaciihabitans tibetensis TaxID=1266600 RepID=A0A2T0VBQ0_9MICO|nr:biliverdin-producing heme oxygenase [Glaciihabitans tibetensis]PRY67624.1 heme oxygenase [Glaciihabitans tibetensis]
MTTLAASASVAEPFAVRLRTQTQNAHTRAESAGFMSRLMGGTGSIDQYVALIGQYFFIYEALERVGESFRTDPVGQAFISDALLRRQALEADLSFFSGPNWRETIEPLPATVTYVERLEAVASNSALFVAHHYLRYLGDLSGGQIIRVMVQRHYGISEEGLSFLIFPEVPKPKPFKDAYRVALEDAEWSADDRDDFILEVDRAYGLNFDLFTQLGESTAAK